MNKIALLVLIGLLPVFSLAQQQQEICADQKNGWRTRCLREQGQIADEVTTRTYWALQQKITALSGSVSNASYVTQLKSLLKKNELDFIVYGESYCNMRTVLGDVETEINKILYCQIATAQLRTEELKRLIISVDQKTRSLK